MLMRELYQELILDHGRNPRNFAMDEHATHNKEGYNPLCGDAIRLYLTEKNGVIEKVFFQGKGCAISIASASLMTEAIRGKTVQEAGKLFNEFHDLLTKDQCEKSESLGKLIVLSGVAEFPMRVKCATLAWHTLMAALSGSDNNNLSNV